MDPKTNRGAAASGERGSSLIEVLIALFVMLVLTLGVLQMFSMAYLVNLGSAARTQLTFKCEQVTENLRIAAGLVRAGGAVPMNSGIVFAEGTYDIPYTGSEAEYLFWGPQGANVVENPNPPYRMSYDIADEGGTYWRITVTATPNQEAGAQHYIGAGINGKRVTYVSRIVR